MNHCMKHQAKKASVTETQATLDLEDIYLSTVIYSKLYKIVI